MYVELGEPVPIPTESAPPSTNSILALPSDSTRKSRSPESSLNTIPLAFNLKFSPPLCEDAIKPLEPPFKYTKLFVCKAIPLVGILPLASSSKAPESVAPVAAIVELNVAAPAADISRVRAVMVEPPSIP